MKHLIRRTFLFSIFLTAAFLFTLIITQAATAATYYSIDANGNGTAIGGGCSAIGNWDQNTKTCTLTTDIIIYGYGGIEIDGNDVTLEGAGHSLTGDNSALNPGVYLNGVSGTSSVSLSVRDLKINNFSTGIQVSGSNGASIFGNTISTCTVGLFLDASSGNTKANFIGFNTFQQNQLGYYIWDSNSNVAEFNTFISNVTQALIGGTSTGNQVLGNYWSDYHNRSQGCINTTPFDYLCDSPYTFSGGSDLHPTVLQDVEDFQKWTWYDDMGGDDWILLGNRTAMNAFPVGLLFGLNVGGASQPLGTNVDLGGPGFVKPGSVIYNKLGLIGGPVDATASADFSKAVTSQRILWPKGGNSLEEVPGTSVNGVSDKMIWPWYDMGSLGYQNWILVSNPNDYQIHYSVRIGGNTVAADNIVPAGGKDTPQFPGAIGGPVEVDAWNDQGDPAFIMASQRVLSNYGGAFNEVPGTPASKLGSDYLWTWYDMQTPGAADWVLVANNDAVDIYYEVWIGGSKVKDGGPISTYGNETPTFPGTIGGPVEVKCFSDAGHSTPASCIASQRTIWGPSFEEVSGKKSSDLTSNYDWTWYDQESAGALDWILVALQPGEQDTVTAVVTFTDQSTGTPVTLTHDITPAEQRWTPSFNGKMGGPVHVSAHKQGNPIISKSVIASQRVLWNGYFNEVWGQ